MSFEIILHDGEKDCSKTLDIPSAPAFAFNLSWGTGVTGDGVSTIIMSTISTARWQGVSPTGAGSASLLGDQPVNLAAPVNCRLVVSGTVLVGTYIVDPNYGGFADAALIFSGLLADGNYDFAMPMGNYTFHFSVGFAGDFSGLSSALTNVSLLVL